MAKQRDAGEDDSRDNEPEPLFSPKLNGFPYRGIYQSLACGAAASWLAYALRLGGAVVVLTYVVVALGAALVLVWRPAVESASTLLAFDEGGVRLQRRSTASYHPYERTSRASFVPGNLTSASKIEIGSDRALPITVHVLARMGKYDAENLVRRYNVRAKATNERVPDPGIPLVRGGRDLDAWCADLARAAKKTREGGYRKALAPDELLIKIFRDRRYPVEARAAAGHFLLALESSEAREVVRARLGPASPPLVLALARLAPCGRDVVSPGDLDAAIPFLADADRKRIAAG